MGRAARIGREFAAQRRSSTLAMARRLAPLAALGLLMVVSLLDLLYVTRGQTFYGTDQFRFAFYRQGWSADALLTPYNGHLMAIPTAVFHVLFDIGRFDDYHPYRYGAMPLTLITACLLFMYARKRVGDWPAVAFAAVILFFGTAWPAILVPIGILSFVVPVAAGIAALLALDRDDLKGDVMACALLILGLLSHSVAMLFLAVAAIELVLDPAHRRRLWVVGVPAALYVTWYAVYSAGGEHQGSTIEHAQHNGAAAGYVYKGIAMTFGTLAGPSEIAREQGSSIAAQRTIGAAVAVCIAGALIAVWSKRPTEKRPRLWALIAALLAFWIVAALARGNGSVADDSRYLYPSAVLLILIVLEVLRGVRLNWIALSIIAGAACLSLVPNLIALGYYGSRARERSWVVGARLSALELEEPWVKSHTEWSFRPSPQLPTAGEYFRLGTRIYSSSPAPNPSEIRSLGPQQRAAADRVLEDLLGLRLASKPALRHDREGGGTASEGCLGQRSGRANLGVEFVASSDDVLVEATGARPVQIRVRRFGDPSSAQLLGSVPAGSARELRLPADRLVDPWRLQLEGGPVVACRTDLASRATGGRGKALEAAGLRE
jgi:hypothetical protein